MKKQQILIIDDDPNIRKTLSDILKIKGYEPLNAENGTEGLELLKQSSANLVIVDLGLPDMSGLEVLDRIKTNHPSTEVIILTGNASLDSAIEATNKGAFSYMLKPYEIDQMMLPVRHAIEKHEAEAKIVRHTVELEKANTQLSEKNRELAKEIAERKQAEKELKENAEKYQRFFMTSRDCVFITSEEGSWIDMNDAALGLFGYASREELMQVRIPNLYADSEERKRHIRFIVEHGYSKEYPIDLLKKDGTVMNTLITSVALHDAEGKVTGFQGTIRDITDRKRAEEALKQSEAYFRSLIENSSDIITILNEDGTVRYMSPSVERVAGFTSAELTGRDIFEYVHPDDVSSAKNIFVRVLQNPGGTASVELRLRHHDGSWHIYEIVAQNLLNDEAVKGIVINSHDITVRRQAEEKIQASLREKETLLKEIHHRVKNNLQVVSSLLNLQSGYLKDREALEVFRESQSRVNTIALVHTKLYQSENLSEIDCAGFIKDLVGSLLQTHGDRMTGMEVRVDISNVYLNIEQAIPCGLIVNELITNALKHAFPEGRKGEVNIIMRSDEKCVVMKFQDNGVGFPPDLDFRNTQSLGLQLVNILVVQLRGTIELMADGGAAFTITFPIQDK